MRTTSPLASRETIPLSGQPERPRPCRCHLVAGSSDRFENGGSVDQEHRWRVLNVQRHPSGELKITLYINSDHEFLPGSTLIDWT
jgi:hypothetical protein